MITSPVTLNSRLGGAYVLPDPCNCLRIKGSFTKSNPNVYHSSFAMIKLLTSVILTGLLSLCVNAATKIMPLGDSITGSPVISLVL